MLIQLCTVELDTVTLIQLCTVELDTVTLIQLCTVELDTVTLIQLCTVELDTVTLIQLCTVVLDTVTLIQLCTVVLNTVIFNRQKPNMFTCGHHSPIIRPQLRVSYPKGQSHSRLNVAISLQVPPFSHGSTSQIGIVSLHL